MLISFLRFLVKSALAFIHCVSLHKGVVPLKVKVGFGVILFPIYLLQMFCYLFVASVSHMFE